MKTLLAGVCDRIPSSCGARELGRIFSRLISRPSPQPLALERRFRLEKTDLSIRYDVSRWTGNELYLLGRHYELKSMALWMRLCRQADAVADVGANVGLYSVLAAAARPDLRIVAIEPDTANVELLRGNLERFSGARILPGCLVGEGEMQGSWGRDEKGGGMRWRNGEGCRSDPGPALYRFSDLRRELGESGRVVLKLDVEGLEEVLLLDASFWDVLRPQAVLVEIAAADRHREEEMIRKVQSLSGLKAVRVESLLSMPLLRKGLLSNWLFSR